MGKRKDHHKQIIQEAFEILPDRVKVTKFHTAQKMPRVLRGVPDLYLMYKSGTFWIEIKPRYANYMRDQMSDLQWTWLHERYYEFTELTRYAIVENAEELVSVVLNAGSYPIVHLGEYHEGRYMNWRRGR